MLACLWEVTPFRRHRKPLRLRAYLIYRDFSRLPPAAKEQYELARAMGEIRLALRIFAVAAEMMLRKKAEYAALRKRAPRSAKAEKAPIRSRKSSPKGETQQGAGFWREWKSATSSRSFLKERSLS